jgi:hypothetical protein
MPLDSEQIQISENRCSYPSNRRIYRRKDTIIEEKMLLADKI